MYLNIKDINDNIPKVNGLILVPFLVEHAMDISAGEFAGYSAQRIVGVRALLESQAQHGFAYTCFLYGEPVACFGCVPLWKGVAEMWSVIGDVARTRPIAMTKIGITLADMAEIAMGLHRLQITVKTSDARAISWGKAIGFISECTMKQYSDDKQDYDLMVRR
jgi:hypothetical protein